MRHRGVEHRTPFQRVQDRASVPAAVGSCRRKHAFVSQFEIRGCQCRGTTRSRLTHQREKIQNRSVSRPNHRLGASEAREACGKIGGDAAVVIGMTRRHGRKANYGGKGWRARLEPLLPCDLAGYRATPFRSGSTGTLSNGMCFGHASKKFFREAAQGPTATVTRWPIVRSPLGGGRLDRF
jgi:hypothetical protein